MCKSEKLERYPIYGTFEIYTGENMKYLGTHTGYIDELAFALADEAVESLFFKNQSGNSRIFNIRDESVKKHFSMID